MSFVTIAQCQKWIGVTICAILAERICNPMGTLSSCLAIRQRAWFSTVLANAQRLSEVRPMRGQGFKIGSSGWFMLKKANERSQQEHGLLEFQRSMDLKVSRCIHMA